MKTLLFFMLAATDAAILQLPIHAHHNHDAYGSTVRQTSLGRPIKSFGYLFYKVNITIGTPPQSFGLALDTMKNDVFVPSVDCVGPCYFPRNHTYNSSQSSTYLKHGGFADSDWAGVNYRGLFSYDTIHLGGFDVTDFLFEEWTSAICVTIGCIAFGYDGLLGLAPPWKQKNQEKQNLLSALLSQKTLDEPIFSLELPVGPHDEGQLLFGALDPKVDRSALIGLPVINVADPPFSGGWTVFASKILFASPHPLNLTLEPGGYAVLDSASPYLLLPPTLAKNLTAALGARPGPAYFHNIPCERRQELPLLTFTLSGHDFSISAFEYTLEVDPPDEGRMCITTFMSTSDFGFPSDWNFILLGSPFFRAFHSVWDFESRIIGLANIERS